MEETVHASPCDSLYHSRRKEACPLPRGYRKPHMQCHLHYPHSRRLESVFRSSRWGPQPKAHGVSIKKEVNGLYALLTSFPMSSYSKCQP